jgi:hypothetical protein
MHTAEQIHTMTARNIKKVLFEKMKLTYAGKLVEAAQKRNKEKAKEKENEQRKEEENRKDNKMKPENNKQAKHEEVRFSCNQCDLKVSSRDYLTKHMQAQHCTVG